MAGGTLTINFTDDSGAPHIVNVGSVTSWSNTVQKRGMATPVVTQGVQNSFPIENGNSQSYTFKFTHHNGQGGMTNALWCSQMTECVDRWQARTDGCKIIYEPEPDNPYAPRMELDGYIKTLTMDYTKDFNEIITGSITFSIGHMNVKGEDPPSGAKSFDDMRIMMSDSKCMNWYAIHYGVGTDAYSCVNSVKIIAGPESPFEYAVFEIPRKKLMEQVPDLYGDIMDGMNKVFLNIMGEHNMFVQKVDSSGDTITITAYCDAQLYKSKVLSGDVTDKAFNAIQTILTDSSLGVSFPPDSIMYKYDPSVDSAGDVSLPRGTNVYRALQLCARLMNCRLFFADNKAFIVDYMMDPSTPGTHNITVDYTQEIWLRDSTKNGPRIVGSSSCDNTGFDPVKNHCTVEYPGTNESGDTIMISEEVFDKDKKSCNAYGILDKGTIKLPELNGIQARKFARNLLGYLREPQRSMTFTVKETYGVTGQQGKSWAPYFPTCSAVGKITDSYNSEEVTNFSDLAHEGVAYQKLILSEYVRQYPKGVTQYTFGMIASVELSDNLSQTSNSLNS